MYSFESTHSGAQVAATWSTSDLASGTTATGDSISAAAATTNQALLEAQKKLRISQQQVWRTVAQTLHALQPGRASYMLTATMSSESKVPPSRRGSKQVIFANLVVEPASENTENKQPCVTSNGHHATGCYTCARQYQGFYTANGAKQAPARVCRLDASGRLSCMRSRRSEQIKVWPPWLSW